MQPVFDYEASLARMGDDPQLFGEMVGLLREDGPRRLSEVQAGAGERNATRVVHAAHTLKGLAGNFSAARAVAAAWAVEQFARNVQWNEMASALDELEAAFAELLAAMTPFAAPAEESV
jgi:HPt (histidine-containing phosphotransfer) domain-containing protein